MANLFSDFSPYGIAPMGARVRLSAPDSMPDMGGVAARSAIGIPAGVLSGIGIAHLVSRMRPGGNPGVANAIGIGIGALIWFKISKGN